MATYARYAALMPGGNVIGPGATTAGDIAVYADTTGLLLADSNFNISTNTLTLKAAATMNIKGFTNGAGAASALALRGGDSTGNLGGAITVTAGSTQQAGNGASVTITGGSNTVGGGGTTIVAAGTSNAASQTGGNLSLRGGQPGSGGTSGSIGFTTGTSAGGSTRATIDGSGNIFLGNAALATNATNGFVSIPSMAGVPSGTPTLTTGLVPIIWNSTDDRMVVYSGGAWKIIQNIIPETDAGNSSTAITIDFSQAPAQKITLTGNVTITLSGMKSGGSYALRIASGAGGFTAVIASAKYPGGTVPTFTASAGATDLVSIYSPDGSIILAQASLAFS